MARFRKILCISAALLAVCGAGTAAARSPRLLRAALSQRGRSLVASVRTTRPVALAGLERTPRMAARGGRFLCLEIGLASGGGRRICLGGRRPHRSAGLEIVGGGGLATSRRAIPVRLKRADPRKLVLSLSPADAGLKPRRYRWRIIDRLARCPRGRRRGPCGDSLPGRGTRAFRLRPVRAVGCTGGGTGLVTNGPRDRDVVALTFDDGPSDYTPEFLDVLREKHAVGTFFEIGQEMAGREATMRRILQEGSEIGDHTMNHVEYPDYSQILGPRQVTEEYTHFKPCLFRPPGGAVDSTVIGTAAGLGMRTVTWDVDPTDWANPGSGAVYSRVVGAARPGSIILMHDGGGPREGTLAALPSIIDTLRARGYRFATVSELLGGRVTYQPYG